MENNNNNNINKDNPYITQFTQKQKELADKIMKFIENNKDMPNEELFQKIMELSFSEQSIPKEIFEPIMKGIMSYAKAQASKTTASDKKEEKKEEDKGIIVER